MISATQTCVQLFPVLKRSIIPQAVFQDGANWRVGDTITVSFIDPATDLDWEFTLPQIKNLLSPADYEIEQKIRNLKSYKDIVIKVIQTYIQPIVPTLTFKFVDEGGVVRVGFDVTKGSYSIVGTLARNSTDPFTTTFGWLDTGTIIHEFSHVLGMLHELESPNEKIPWNYSAVYDYYKKNNGWDNETTYNNVLKPDAPNQVSSSDFDPASIMIYPIPAKLTTNGFHTDINLRYSSTDIQYLGKTYSVEASVIKDNIDRFTKDTSSVTQPTVSPTQPTVSPTQPIVSLTNGGSSVTSPTSSNLPTASLLFVIITFLTVLLMLFLLIQS